MIDWQANAPEGTATVVMEVRYVDMQGNILRQDAHVEVLKTPELFAQTEEL